LVNGDPGVRIGVDVGSVRVGVAASDPDARLAFPVTALRRREDAADLDELAGIVAERAAVEVVVGLPRTLAGREGPAVAAARAYGEALAAKVAPIPVIYSDERLTTVAADRQLRAAKPRSTARDRRGVIDAAAATGILQNYLDVDRSGAARARATETGGLGA
jgi:putative holliday junction resolvase